MILISGRHSYCMAVYCKPNRVGIRTTSLIYHPEMVSNENPGIVSGSDVSSDLTRLGSGSDMSPNPPTHNTRIFNKRGL